MAIANFDLKLRRNSTLAVSYEAAKTALTTQLDSMQDGGVAICSYGEIWEKAKTLLGVVRINGDKKSHTFYEAFDQENVKTGQGVHFVEKNETKVLDIKLDPNNKNILSLGENGLLGEISLAYDSTNKKLQIKKGSGDSSTVLSEIDATSFVKDGMLKDAALVVNPSGQTEGTYIKLEWNTDATDDGALASNPMYINVTSLIDIYTGGKGIAISDANVISVKLDDNNNEKNGTGDNATAYLKVGDDGLYVSGINDKIDNEIKAILKEYEKTVFVDPFEATVSGASTHVEANDEVGVAVKKVENTINLLATEVIANEEVVSQAFAKVVDAVGIKGGNGEIKYAPVSNANYINNASSVHDATIKLDAAIKNASESALKVSKDDNNAITSGTDGGIFVSSIIDAGTY